MSPPLNTFDPTIDDWLLTDDDSRGRATSTTVGPSVPSMPTPLPSPESVLLTSTPVVSETESPQSPTHTLPTSPEEIVPTSPGLPELLGRGHRHKTPSVLLKDYVTHSASTNPPSRSLSL